MTARELVDVRLIVAGGLLCAVGVAVAAVAVIREVTR